MEQAERYEIIAEVFKLLQPFYEKSRDFEKMRDMYGKLHVSFKRVVEIMATGKRYLGTFFRIAFYGKVCIRLYIPKDGRSYLMSKKYIYTLTVLISSTQKS